MSRNTSSIRQMTPNDVLDVLNDVRRRMADIDPWPETAGFTPWTRDSQLSALLYIGDEDDEEADARETIRWLEWLFRIELFGPLLKLLNEAKKHTFGELCD